MSRRIRAAFFSALALSLASYAIAVGQGLLGGIVHVTREIREPKEHSPDPPDAADPAAAPEG